MNEQRIRRILVVLLVGLAVILLVTGAQGSTAPVYRIGVALPLEGRYREIGYDIFFASRLALLDALQTGTPSGYRVELVIYDDFGDPVRAAANAEALTVDPAVLVVIGHWWPATTEAALPIYQAAGMPLVTAEGLAAAASPTQRVFILDARPEEREAALAAYLDEQGISPADGYLAPPTASVTGAAALARNADARLRIGDTLWGTRQFRALTSDLSTELWFVTNAIWPANLADPEGFRQAILESDPSAREPGPFAALAHDATALALDAIRRAQAAGPLTREAVAAALAASDYSGLTGPITFEPDGFRQAAPLYLYRWEDTSAPTLLERLQ